MIQARLQALEEKVQALQDKVNKLENRGAAPQQAKALKSRTYPARPSPGGSTLASGTTPKKASARQAAKRDGSLLNKAGIGLILFGIIFLFKYSIDQNWITPHVRILFGLMLATGLMLAGLKLFSIRPKFSQVLSGGGIGAYYISIFAAFQIYAIIPHGVAFGAMVIVTGTSFALSLNKHAMSLAVIGTLGGVLTPFLLYTGSGNIPGLMTYMCLLIAGAGGIYFQKGWKPVLFAGVAGGWLTILVAMQGGAVTYWSSLEKVAIQAGVLFNWLIFWLLPVFNNIRNKTRSEVPASGKPEKTELTHWMKSEAHTLTLSSAMIGFTLSRIIWSFTDNISALICLVLSVLFAGAFLYLKRHNEKLAFTHLLTALLMLALSFAFYLQGDSLFFALAAETAAMYLIGQRTKDKAILLISLFFAYGVASLLVIRLLTGGDVPMFINAKALTDLAVIGLFLAVSLRIPSQKKQKSVMMFAHCVILVFVYREGTLAANGQGITTIIWSIYAISLLIYGAMKNQMAVYKVAMLTIGLIIFKLFAVDLKKLETLWRILLFLGLGGLFLLLSYQFPKLIKDDEPPESDAS